MRYIGSITLLSILLFSFGTLNLSASTPGIYAVGACKPGVPSFTTIQAALSATPAPTTVEVCPGTYNEQVVITQGVTLEGISSGDSNQAIIASPPGGMVDSIGITGVQLWINNATGPVTIINLTIDGTGSGLNCNHPNIDQVYGIFVQNTPATINHVTVRNQTAGGCGYGIWLEGGASNPLVTVENSSVHDFDNAGIVSEANFSPTLTATIKNNYINGSKGYFGIDIDLGATATVTGNTVVSAQTGIFAGPPLAGMVAAGSVSGNTLVNNSTGVYAAADDVAFSSNKIQGSTTAGVFVASAVGTIKSNTITQAPTGINFNCSANPNVKSNILIDATTGLSRVPMGVGLTNSYFNVATIQTGC